MVYHLCNKKVADLNVWDSNHEDCQNVNVPIFKYLLAKCLVSFFIRLIRSESPCVQPFRYYLKCICQQFIKLWLTFSCRSFQFIINLRVLFVLYAPGYITYSVKSSEDVEFCICVSVCIVFPYVRKNDEYYY